jgi:hypothetical protein
MTSQRPVVYNAHGGKRSGGFKASGTLLFDGRII